MLLAPSRPRPGAALLEVVIALVFAGLLLAPLARATTIAMHHFGRAAARDRAAALQSHVLARLRADPCAGSISRDSTVGHATVSWSATPAGNGSRELQATVTLPNEQLSAGGADACP